MRYLHGADFRVARSIAWSTCTRGVEEIHDVIRFHRLHGLHRRGRVVLATSTSPFTRKYDTLALPPLATGAFINLGENIPVGERAACKAFSRRAGPFRLWLARRSGGSFRRPSNPRSVAPLRAHLHIELIVSDEEPDLVSRQTSESAVLDAGSGLVVRRSQSSASSGFSASQVKCPGA
jgi:hypothetical protein